MDVQRVMALLLPQVAERHGEKFTRTVEVTHKGVGGDVKVSRDRVVIDTFFAISGNPIETAIRIIQLCRDYDERPALERERCAVEVLDGLRGSLQFALRIAGEERVRALLKEEGMG